MELTARQKTILKYIIEEYSLNAEPVSSSKIISTYMSNLSSATIRNEMNILEKLGFLEKSHISSGRKPSLLGYKLYETEIMKPKVEITIKEKLEKIFSNRGLLIDTVINQSVEIINSTLKLPVIITKTNNELLKRFDLIRIDNTKAIVLIITSGSSVIKHDIDIENEKLFSDIATCVRVLNDRLIDTPISEINSHLNVVKSIVKKMVTEYEYCVKQIISKILNSNFIEKKVNVIGTKYLTNQPEWKNIDKLNNILEFLENSNIWKHISSSVSKTGKTSFTYVNSIESNLSDITIASTTIDNKFGGAQLSIIGPNRIKYPYVQWILDYLKQEIEKYL